MPDLLMPSIELLAMTGIQLLHHPTQRNFSGLQEQVKVIAHQAIRTAPDPESCRRDGEPYEEICVVAGVDEDLLASVAARHHVIQRAGNMQSQGTSHRSFVR